MSDHDRLREECFWLLLLGTLMVSEARASVALSHDPDCQTLTLEDAGNDE